MFLRHSSIAADWPMFSKGPEPAARPALLFAAEGIEITPMTLKSLVLSSDEKIVRVLRRTLSELEIGMEHCPDAESAVRKLTRERFEAVIVDCDDPLAASVLRSARNAPSNKRAIAVAIVDGGVGLRSAFDLGAHFVLYKPLSSERAKSSFRAVRALMKRERRRNSRHPIQIPVSMSNREGASLKVVTTDLSEGGMAVTIPRNNKPVGRWQLNFALPGASGSIEVAGELAWEGVATQVGMRFLDLSPDTEHHLRDWLNNNSPEGEKDDPPIGCQLTDLSMGGCYLKMASPFPVATRVTLSMKAAGVELRAEGLVRVMHPEVGMGVEFLQTTPEHRQSLEAFLNVLTDNRDVMPELLVQPEGLDAEVGSEAAAARTAAAADPSDGLLELFRDQSGLSTDAFQEELRKQRAPSSPAKAASAKATS